jgi:hypothetical protein
MPGRCTASSARLHRSASSARTEQKRFALTPVGELLRRDVAGSLHGWAAFVGALLAACDFGRFETVVDVGGGNGALLAALLGH